MPDPILKGEQLAQAYRDEVIAKLPPQSLLSAADLASFKGELDVTQVPNISGLMTPSQIAITEMHATELCARMADGKLTAEETMLAFGLRAAIAHQVTCCLIDLFLEEALVRARKLDAHFRETGKTVGPLHGLPISVKDQLQLIGHKTSTSFLSLHSKAVPSEVDAHLCQILANAGAIFYCHTSLPQTIMHLECESFWGRTLNPFNTNLTSGGSSGGEGALMGMKGSVMGIGTDIGGSVRVPAANCGLYGLRPTTGRLASAGCKTYVPGRDSILGTCGPFAQSLQDIQLFMSVACGQAASPWNQDPSLLELPWRGSELSMPKLLKVGIMWDDGQVTPVKPIREALKQLQVKLNASDRIKVVKFTPYKTRAGWELIRRLYFPDGAKRARSLLKDFEEMKPLTKWLLEEAGEPLKEITEIHALWDLNVERETYRAGYLQHWNDHDIDVLLCPAGPSPAPMHGMSKWWAYTSVFNLVDYPAIAFPVHRAVSGSSEEDDSPQEKASFTPMSKDDVFLHGHWRAKDHVGAPISLQLVARKYHDEELLQALEVIEEVLHGEASSSLKTECKWRKLGQFAALIKQYCEEEAT